MLEHVYSYMLEQNMIMPGRTILVGLSGGADSVCLLRILLALQERTGMPVEAVHMNHQIRGEEAWRDETFVRELCKRLQIPCHVVTEDVPGYAEGHGMSLEEAGRFLRYHHFAELAAEKKSVVAVAHHRDDEDETMLFHLFRGSGIHGLAGMRPMQKRKIGEKKMLLIRPLLTVDRARIEGYLRTLGQEYVTDSTNLIADTGRNHLRLKVLPYVREHLFEDVSKALQRERRMFAQTEEYLTGQAADFLAHNGHAKPDQGIYWVMADSMQQCHPALLPYVFREMIRSILDTEPTDLFTVHYEKLQELSGLQSGRRISLPGGLQAFRDFDRLVLCIEAMETTEESLKARDCELEQEIFAAPEDFLEKNYERICHLHYTKWLDCDKIKGMPILRTRMPGDYLCINEKGNRKKLQDYMVEQRIPAHFRDEWPVVAVGSEIIWVCGYRINDTCKITKDTGRVMRLTLKIRTKSIQEDYQ